MRDSDRKLVSNSPKLKDEAGGEGCLGNTDPLWAPDHWHSDGTRVEEPSVGTAISKVIQLGVGCLPNSRALTPEFSHHYTGGLK